MKEPTISELRERITLCKITSTVDSELNRVESIVPVQTVWARAEVRSSNVDSTTAGTRPVLRYIFTIRSQSIECDCVQWHGKTLYLNGPWYSISPRYIVIEAVEIAGDRYE